MIDNTDPIDIAFEQHYTVAEVAEKMHIDGKTARRLFENQPGVLRLESTGTINKRKYTSIRIPQSVWLRVHRENRLNKPHTG